jgi:hypothetical protein
LVEQKNGTAVERRALKRVGVRVIALVAVVDALSYAARRALSS